MYLVETVDMNVNRIIKFIGWVGFSVGLFFALQAKRQVGIADEFMQLSAKCVDVTIKACETMQSDSYLLLSLWDGNLQHDLMFSFLSWSIWIGMLIYTNKKTELSSDR